MKFPLVRKWSHFWVVLLFISLIFNWVCVIAHNSHPNNPPVENVYQLGVLTSEWGYFHGQRDALNGHIIIVMDSLDNLWYWNATPFTRREKPLYNPRVGLINSVKEHNLNLPKFSVNKP